MIWWSNLMITSWNNNQFMNMQWYMYTALEVSSQMMGIASSPGEWGYKTSSSLRRTSIKGCYRTWLITVFLRGLRTRIPIRTELLGLSLGTDSMVLTETGEVGSESRTDRLSPNVWGTRDTTHTPHRPTAARCSSRLATNAANDITSWLQQPESETKD